MNEIKSVAQSDTSTPVLAFDEIRFQRSGETAIQLNRFTTSIRPGEIVKATLKRNHNPREFVSLMLGLVEPQGGVIRFRGDTWEGTDYDRHFKMRSRIGRVFSGTAWIQNLTVRENLRLSMSHHGKPDNEINDRVGLWTKRFGGERLTLVQRAIRQRPAKVEPSLLQVCQYIRAFCINPFLVLLERPTSHVDEWFIEKLLYWINQFLAGGGAVIWLANDRQDFLHTIDSDIQHWRIEDGFMTVQTGISQ